MVVMNGLATTAGSNPIFLMSIGSVQPTTFAKKMVRTRVSETTSDTIIVTSSFWSNIRSTMSIFTKLATARMIPHRIETLDSLKITLKMSLNSISPRDSERMIVTEDCEPELPAVPISIGINEVRTIDAARLDSNESIIMVVNVAEIISMSNHGIRLLKISNTDNLS